MISFYLSFKVTFGLFETFQFRVKKMEKNNINLVYRFFNLGSRASLKPSPNNIKPNTVSKIIKPGQNDAHGAVCRNSLDSERSPPHSIKDGSRNPRKASPAKLKIIPPTAKVKEIITG